MRYQKILMDIDDTIFDFQAGNRRAVAQLMEELGLASPTVFEEYQAINHACWEALERGEMTQAQLQVIRWARFLEKYNIDRDAVQVADRFVEILGQQCILLPHAEEAVRFISSRMPVIIVTSGITKVQKSRIALSSIRDVISGLIISQELGVSKPNPEIFHYALKQFDLRPEEALVIGDSPSSDIRGANNAGIDACWYNPKGKTLPEGVFAKYTIADIRQLISK